VANFSATTTTALLNTAGISPDQYGLDVYITAANRSVLMPLVRRYLIEGGSTLYIPIVGTRSATARTRGTDDTELIVSTALDDTAASMTKRFTYDAISKSWATINDMPPAHLAAWLNAENVQMGAALANDFDSTVIAAVYSAATTNAVGSGAVDFSYDLFVSAIQKLRAQNAPEPYFAVLPETQWDHIAKTDEFTRYDARGEGDTMQNRQSFRAHGVSVFTTNNVATSGGEAQAIVFSGEAIAVAIRNFAQIEQWSEQLYTANFLMAWADYAYAIPLENYACQFTTTDT